jgi:hypothetical protein
VAIGAQCTREDGADLTRAAGDHDPHRLAPIRAGMTIAGPTDEDEAAWRACPCGFSTSMV